MAIGLGSNVPFFTFGGQNDLDNSLILTVVPANLTATSQVILNNRILPLTSASLTASGNSLGDIGSSAWQYVTVTSLSLIGQEITLFNMLSGVTPELGDVWRIPTFSTDGGQVLGYGSGRFQISQPTSGPDTLENILYHDISTGTWHGPQNATIQSTDKTLPVLPPNISSRGNTIELSLKRIVDPALLSIDSAQIRLDRLYSYSTEIFATGNSINLNGQLPVTTATLTATGKTINLQIGTLTLPVDKANLTLTSAEIGRDITISATPGALSITSKNIQLYTSKFTVDAAHISANGASIFLLSDANPLQLVPARLTANGKEINISAVEAVPNYIAAAILGL